MFVNRKESSMKLPVTPKLPEYPRISFITSTMRGGKSSRLLADRFNAIQRGFETIIIKPTKDTRDGEFKNEWGFMTSRFFPGQQYKAFYAAQIDNKFIKDILLDGAGARKYDRVFVDEVQFFEPADIETLAGEVVHKMGIPVKCYGLQADINSNLFPGSAKLLAITVPYVIPYDCEMQCGDLASVHLRFKDGVLDKSGESVAIEQGEITYLSVCPKCWQGIINNDKTVKFR